MMKTKYLLAALSLPLAFAACSDDFDELSSNVPVNQGGDIKVTLNLTKDADLNSRATWSGSQLGWQESDMISMYWTGTSTVTVNSPLNGASNAIFKTADVLHLLLNHWYIWVRMRWFILLIQLTINHKTLSLL